MPTTTGPSRGPQYTPRTQIHQEHLEHTMGMACHPRAVTGKASSKRVDELHLFSLTSGKGPYRLFGSMKGAMLDVEPVPIPVGGAGVPGKRVTRSLAC